MALELSDAYKKILDARKFQSLMSYQPWPHFVLDNFIAPLHFQRVQERMATANTDYHLIADHPAQLQLNYLHDTDLAAFFFSTDVRALFEGIANSQLRPNENVAIQVRRMTPESPIFPPHHDFVEQASLVALYYVAPNWHPENGGELLLLKEESSKWRGPSAKWISPLPNRLLLFMSHEHHWHCVRKVNRWTRLMVLTEWLKVA